MNNRGSLKQPKFKFGYGGRTRNRSPTEQNPSGLFTSIKWIKNLNYKTPFQSGILQPKSQVLSTTCQVYVRGRLGRLRGRRNAGQSSPVLIHLNSSHDMTHAFFISNQAQKTLLKISFLQNGRFPIRGAA